MPTIHLQIFPEFRIKVSSTTALGVMTIEGPLLCVAKPSTASMNDLTKLRGLELQRKIGLAIRFDDIETDIGTCLPIQVVVSVFLIFLPVYR